MWTGRPGDGLVRVRHQGQELSARARQGRLGRVASAQGTRSFSQRAALRTRPPLQADRRVYGINTPDSDDLQSWRVAGESKDSSFSFAGFDVPGLPSMYVTESFRGTPLQCFVPEPVFPRPLPRSAEKLDAVERQLERAADESQFRESTLAAVLRRDGCPDACGTRRERVEHAIDYAFSIKTLDASALKSINARLNGTARTDYRNGPIWIGSPHPATSTHIGSPTVRLNTLVSQVLAVQSRPGPALFRMLVCLVRLLQIHPFQEANGRTARLLACRMAAASLGNNPLIPRLVASLWNRGSLGINQMSVAIRDHDDWDPLIDAVVAQAQALAAELTPAPPRPAELRESLIETI